MQRETILDAVRRKIGGWAFRVFLWGERLTQDEYLDRVVFIECLTAPEKVRELLSSNEKE